MNEQQPQSERYYFNHGSDFLSTSMITRATIVVDFNDNPEPYERAYGVVDRIVGDDVSALGICEAVNTVVYGTIPFSSNAVCRALSGQARIRNVKRLRQVDQVPLSLFMNGEGGICHQQSLLGAALLQLAQERRGIGGTVAIVNHTDELQNPDRHVSVEYEVDSQKIAIDTCKNLVLSLDDGMSPDSNPYTVQRSQAYLV